MYGITWSPFVFLTALTPAVWRTPPSNNGRRSNRFPLRCCSGGAGYQPISRRPWRSVDRLDRRKLSTSRRQFGKPPGHAGPGHSLEVTRPAGRHRMKRADFLVAGRGRRPCGSTRDGSDWQHLTNTNSVLPDNDIQALLLNQDADGPPEIWIGSEQGPVSLARWSVGGCAGSQQRISWWTGPHLAPNRNRRS